jgi:hypothetical protein
MAKTHWANGGGPVCGVKQGTWVIGPEDLRDVRKEDLRGVTCTRCTKKLIQWGFAVQNFSEGVRDALRK